MYVRERERERESVTAQERRGPGHTPRRMCAGPISDIQGGGGASGEVGLRPQRFSPPGAAKAHSNKCQQCTGLTSLRQRGACSGGEENGARTVHNPEAPPPLLRVDAAAAQDGVGPTSPSVSLLTDAPARQNFVNQDIRALVKNRRGLQETPPPQHTPLSHFALSPDTLGEGCPLFHCYGFDPSAHLAASCTRVRQCRKGGAEERRCRHRCTGVGWKPRRKDI